MNKDLKDYTFIGVGTSTPVFTWKLMKSFSHIIINRLLSNCSLYYGDSQRIKCNDISSIMTIKDIELFYCLIKRLLFTSNMTRPSVLDCVTSLLTTMELPMNYYKNRNLNTDMLSMKKIHMFVLSSPEDRYTHLKILYYGYKNNNFIILQQIIQSRRFMKVSAILKGVSKNMIQWLDISLPTDLTNYNNDHQEHTTNNTRRAKNKLVN